MPHAKRSRIRKSKLPATRAPRALHAKRSKAVAGHNPKSRKVKKMAETDKPLPSDNRISVNDESVKIIEQFAKNKDISKADAANYLIRVSAGRLGATARYERKQRAKLGKAKVVTKKRGQGKAKGARVVREIPPEKLEASAS